MVQDTTFWFTNHNVNDKKVMCFKTFLLVFVSGEA